jgi:hypothetical protein
VRVSDAGEAFPYELTARRGFFKASFASLPSGFFIGLAHHAIQDSSAALGVGMTIE